MPSARASFDGAASVRDARRFVRETLGAWGAGQLEWVVTTVTSELATNAVLHAGTGYTVQLGLSGGTLRLDVADGSSLPLVRRRYGSESTTGRGVRLMQQLCRSWSVEVTATGKVVHCEIAVDGSPAVAVGLLDDPDGVL